MNGTSEITQRRIRRWIRRYRRLTRRLEAVGGPERNGPLFERICALEEQIVSACGVSPTQDHLSLFYQMATMPKAAPETIIAILEVAAGTEEPLAPLEALFDGLHAGEPACNVLPRMGLPIHVYLEFLYDLARDSPNAAIDLYNEMQRARDHLDEIGKAEGLIDALVVKNLPYLPWFLFRHMTP